MEGFFFKAPVRFFTKHIEARLNIFVVSAEMVSITDIKC